jgi:hypothetical protein
LLEKNTEKAQKVCSESNKEKLEQIGMEKIEKIYKMLNLIFFEQTRRDLHLWHLRLGLRVATKLSNLNWFRLHRVR